MPCVEMALVWQQVLAKASPGQRALASLLGQGYTTVEAADILGIAPMAAHQRVAALRKHLQDARTLT
jgi:DNA-binding CsgD family transcriptional regulator